MRTSDVLIVGAGIVGCACALECIRAGLKVSIVEGATPASGATAAGMGHLVVMDDSPAQLALTSYSSRLWQEIRPSLPTTVEYESCGTLWVAADAEEMAEVWAKHLTYRDAGIQTSVLGAEELARVEPNLRPGLAGALRVTEDAVIYPPAAAGSFLQMAMAEGAELLRGRAAVQMEGTTLLLEDGTRLHAGQVVVATGSDLRLVPSLPIQKRKGHLVITDRYPGFVHHQIVELGYLKSAHKVMSDSVAFNIQPRRTGQLLIGSSRQYGNDDPTVDHQILTAMLDRAYSYLPTLNQLSGIRVWTGFRAATPDKLPLIGPTAEPGVFLAVGFEGLGITNAPGAARLVVDHLLGRCSAIDPMPYLPQRIASPEATHV